MDEKEMTMETIEVEEVKVETTAEDNERALEVAHKKNMWKLEEDAKSAEVELKQLEVEEKKAQIAAEEQHKKRGFWSAAVDKALVVLGIVAPIAFGCYKLSKYEELDERHICADLNGEIASAPTREHEKNMNMYYNK